MRDEMFKLSQRRVMPEALVPSLAIGLDALAEMKRDVDDELDEDDDDDDDDDADADADAIAEANAEADDADDDDDNEDDDEPLLKKPREDSEDSEEFF